MAPLGSKDILTTGDIARLFRVAPRTVQKWSDEGLLVGYRIPGGGACANHRRFHVSDVRNFARKYGIRMKDDRYVCVEILFIGLPSPLVITLVETLGNEFRLATVKDLFSAGLLMSTERPEVVVFDFLLGRSESFTAAEQVREISVFSNVIALAGEDDGFLVDNVFPFDVVLHRPFDPSSLIAVIREALQKRRSIKERRRESGVHPTK